MISIEHNGLSFVNFKFGLLHLFKEVRDSSVGIATGYGLDGPGIGSRWGEIFRTFPDLPWGPPSLLHNEYRVFPGGWGVKQPERGVNHPPHLAPKLKKE